APESQGETMQLSRIPIVKRRSEATNAFQSHDVVSAKADAEVLRHLKETSRNDAGFVLACEEVEKLVGSSAAQPWENDSSELRTEAPQTGVIAQKRIPGFAIAFDDGVGAIRDFLQVVERNHAHEFRGMHRRCSVEVVDPPYAARKVGLSEDPAAAQAA